MQRWERTTPFQAAERQRETWILREGGSEERFPVDVRLGKPIDIMALKVANVESFGSVVESVRATRRALFAGELERLVVCPICAAPAASAVPRLTIFGADYVECPSCTHVFVRARPSRAALEKHYAENEQYQATYTDMRTVEVRVEQVAAPKVRWMVETFEKIHGRAPRRILDVGAGSGHFVYACRRAGLSADGVELSASGRRFAKDQFGIELFDRDFTAAATGIADVDAGAYDIITFWGVIEHVPEPMAMLRAARRRLTTSSPSLVLAEVPRWECLGTAVQAFAKTSVVRHLDPLGHIHCFTDSSLAQALVDSGFAPRAAWYYGMDAYELVTQAAYAASSAAVTTALAAAIPDWQAWIDLGRMSDMLTIAAIPRA